MNDNEILKLLLDKDDTALSELNNAYQHYCFSIAFNILHNYEDAEECVSDTWLRVWNSVPPNHPASLKRYSARITRNLALNRYRDLRTQKCGNGILCHSIEELSECISDGVNIEDIFSRDEIRILFQQFIAELGDADRRIFLRRYYYAEEISTIANRYGMTPVTVRVRLFRLRKQFKDVLEKGGHSV